MKIQSRAAAVALDGFGAADQRLRQCVGVVKGIVPADNGHARTGGQALLPG